jgi:hypothetical protein
MTEIEKRTGITDNCLLSVEPLLSYFAGEPVIETNLTDEEKKWVQRKIKCHF